MASLLRSPTDKVVCLSFMLASLAACATDPVQVRASGPNNVFLTNKTPEQYRDCLADLAPTDFAITPYGEGWRVTRINTGPFIGYVDIVADGEGARVSSYGARGIRIIARKCV